MDVLFAVLGSGSKGNSAYVEHGGAGFLIDAGLGPRVTAWRLGAIGRSWASVASVVVSHCHGDHLYGPTVAHLSRQRARLCLHREHHEVLRDRPECLRIEKEGRLTVYDGLPFQVVPGAMASPLELPHDVPAQGFVIECDRGGRAGSVRIGYASDLGHAGGRFVEAMADCDLLALEFNHDAGMELASGRDPSLIERVLGPNGHLSNDQAAEALDRILRASRRRIPRHVVLLHLSEQCNEERLALGAARGAIRRLGLAGEVAVHAARQHDPGPVLVL